MRVVVQRVSEASVKVNQDVVGSIGRGYVLFAGFTHDDSLDDLIYIINKIKFIRLFDDNNGIMNIDINNIEGSILSISQFTLYADTTKGRRPCYQNAMEFNKAEKMYNNFNELLKTEGHKVETGIFGSDMKVSLVNDGPVTILIDSKEGIYEKHKL